MLHHVPTHRAAQVAALLAASAAAFAQEGSRTPSPLPHQDPDQKTEHWVAPLKGGLAPSGVDHLPLEARLAYDRGLTESLFARRAPETAEAGPKAGESLDPGQMRSGVDPRSFHQLDTAPDGTLWAFGGTYKARFGTDGASYVPFLGSDAPRNFPVTLRTVGATLGGAALEAAAEVAPRFEGATAVYDRGAFTERYDTRVGSMEQLFVFETLPGDGDLVVRIAAESELVAGVNDAGLVFSNSLGAVTYSSAIAIDGRGRRVAAPTRLDGGFIELTVPASFVAGATLPLIIDPVLATYFPSSSTSTDVDTDIAYDDVNGRFMICLQRAFSATDQDIWAEMFDVFGVPIANSGAYIDFTTESWTRPKCANNRIDTQFLVVAVRTSATPTEIWGRTREAESTTQGSQFQISSGSGNKNFPDVGGDPTLFAPSFYCVVWEREFSVGVDHDVHARLVRADSTLLGTSAILVDNSGGTYDKYPNVSKSNGVAPSATQEWNIAWNRQFTTTDWDIRGAQLHWDGTVTQASFSLDFSAANDLLPKPSSPLNPTGGERSYLVTYQRLDAGVWDVYATALRGASVITRSNLTELWGASAGTDEEYPVVDTNGIHFAVAFQHRFVAGSADYDMYVSGIYLSGDTLRLSEGPLNLAFSSSFEGFPEMCARRSAGTISDYAGVVWYDSTNNGNIEGATYNMPDNYGQVGANYCQGFSNSTGQLGVIVASGTSFVAQNALVLQASRLPQNATLFFITSMTQGSVSMPGNSVGLLCLGGAIGRYVGPGQIQNTGSAGAATYSPNLAQHPTPTGLVSVATGQTWNFQAWHRDTVGGTTTSNFTNATSVSFF